jgi:hypothetical protein
MSAAQSSVRYRDWPVWPLQRRWRRPQWLQWRSSWDFLLFMWWLRWKPRQGSTG